MGSRLIPFFAVPTLDFPVTPSIGATVTVAQVAGAYSGLFYEPDGVAARVPVTSAPRLLRGGTFTAKLLLGGRTWAFAGNSIPPVTPAIPFAEAR